MGLTCSRQKLSRFILKHLCVKISNVLQRRSRSFDAGGDVRRPESVFVRRPPRGSGLILSTQRLSAVGGLKITTWGKFAKLRVAEVGFLPPKGHFQLWNSCFKCHSLQIVFKRYSYSHLATPPPPPPSQPSLMPNADWASQSDICFAKFPKHRRPQRLSWLVAERYRSGEPLPSAALKCWEFRRVPVSL